jgi:hypothetical protein
MADLKPTNEVFENTSYNNDTRLSQPSSGVRQVRNVQTERGYDPNRRRGGAADRAASTLSQNTQADRTKAQEATEKAQAEGIRSVAAEQYQNAVERNARTNKSLRLAGSRLRSKKAVPRTAGKFIGRGVTLSIWSWGFFIWLWFQLPFTILSIIFMGVSETLYQFTLTLKPTAEGNYLVNAVKSMGEVIVGTIGKAIEFLADELFGFDINALNPANLFLMTHTLVVLVGWGMLLAIGIIYTMTGQKAFSGKGAGGKNAMFILAFVGYTIPIINLLPLFFLWTWLVLKNPK